MTDVASLDPAQKYIILVSKNIIMCVIKKSYYRNYISITTGIVKFVGQLYNGRQQTRRLFVIIM